MILVGIGANLPGPDGADALGTCRRAAAALDRLGGLRALSRWYATEPVPRADQPDYVNGVAWLRGPADPADLLAALQAIEAGFGRVRSVPNAARTLDLDILAIGALVRAAPDPVVPHPRLHQRAFALAPMADIAPSWVHPVLGRSCAALLQDVAGQSIRVL